MNKKIVFLVVLFAVMLFGGYVSAGIKSENIDYVFDKGELVKTVITTEVVDPTEINEQIRVLALEIKDWQNKVVEINATIADLQAKQNDLIIKRQAIINALPLDQQALFPPAITVIP